jgi:hypothetical protein
VSGNSGTKIDDHLLPLRTQRNSEGVRLRHSRSANNRCKRYRSGYSTILQVGGSWVPDPMR